MSHPPIAVCPIDSGRYGSEEMRALFTDPERYRLFILIEGTVAKVQSRLGMIPEDAAREVWKRARDILVQLVGGLRSGMSYCGAMTVAELWQNAEFCRVSPAGLAEGQPHAVVRSGVDQVQPDYREMEHSGKRSRSADSQGRGAH